MNGVIITEDTALRDIKILIERGILLQEEGGGRSTRYGLADDPPRQR